MLYIISEKERNMNKSCISRSKEFIEKEKKTRQSLRLSIERELIGDMIRLLDDKLYSDVTFVVDDDDFPAHVPILCARAPAFSQNFLPQLLSPTAVQSCIYIQDIKPEEFSEFLRSVYTENKVHDYSAIEYPWTEKVSWSYPKDVVQPEHHEMYNGLEDSIEESQFVDQTDHEGKTGEEESDSKPEEMISCCQQVKTSVGNSEISSGSRQQESDCHEEVKGQDCELVVHECQTSETGAKTKEPKNTGRLNGEEVNFVEMEACCKIGEDLLTLVNDYRTSDITFLLNDAERIKAHRSILCTRSSYFSAMLYGGWTEGQAKEIPLYGIHSSRAFLAVLYYLYGGITRIPLEIADICEVLRLSDMYGLEGLKEVVSCQLRIDKCHLFHKPCSECVTGVIDCLDVSDLFQLSDLKSQSLRWIAKYFDRVVGTKNFASLSKALQDETLKLIQSTVNASNVLDLFSRGEKLSSSVPRIKWAEPVLPLVSSHMDSCLTYIASIFPVIVRQQAFLDMLKGVGWSTPLLEKIFTAVRKHLTVDNCCNQLKEAMRLQSILHADVPEEEGFDSQFTEESYKLVDSLQNRCQKFIVSNLHLVSHTEGWKHLGPKTQNELRKTKGGLFVDIGLPSQAKNSYCDPTKRPPSGTKPAKNPSSLKTSSTGLTSRVRPQSSAGSDNSRRSAQDARLKRTSASTLSSRNEPQGSANRTRRSVQDTALNRTAASSTGLTSRSRRPQSSAGSDNSRSSAQDARLKRTSASTLSSRNEPQGSADRTRRSVQDTTLNRTAASSTGLTSHSRRPQSSAGSDNSRRSAQDARLKRTSASTLSSRNEPQGSADRTRRSVQDTTLNRTAASSTGLTSHCRRPQSSARSDNSRRSAQDARLKRTSASTLSSRNEPQGSADRTHRSVKDTTLNRTAASSTGLTSHSRPQSSAGSDNSRSSAQDARIRRNSASASVLSSHSKPQGSADRTQKSRLERASKTVSQNLPKQESSMRNSRSIDSSTSSSLSAGTSNKKRPNSASKTAVSSSTRPVGLPHRISRSYSDFNRAKLVDVSGRKYLSDPSISETSKPKTRSSRMNGSITVNKSANPGVSSADASTSRIKLARQSFVGPVRLAQRSQPNVGDQKKKKQKVISVNSGRDQKDSAINVKQRQMETQSTKGPLPVQSTPSSQKPSILNETIIIATGSDLVSESSELTSLGEYDRIWLNETEASALVQDDRILLNEAVEVSSTQEDDSIKLLSEEVEASSLQDDRVPLNEEAVEVSSTQEDDSIKLLSEEVEASSLQDDRVPLNEEAVEVSSTREDDSIKLLSEEVEASSTEWVLR